LCPTEIFCITDVPDGFGDVGVNGLSVVAEMKAETRWVFDIVSEGMGGIKVVCCSV
jgi:hypothetical protein